MDKQFQEAILLKELKHNLRHVEEATAIRSIRVENDLAEVLIESVLEIEEIIRLRALAEEIQAEEIIVWELQEEVRPEIILDLPDHHQDLPLEVLPEEVQDLQQEVLQGLLPEVQADQEVQGHREEEANRHRI